MNVLKTASLLPFAEWPGWFRTLDACYHLPRVWVKADRIFGRAVAGKRDEEMGMWTRVSDPDSNRKHHTGNVSVYFGVLLNGKRLVDACHLVQRWSQNRDRSCKLPKRSKSPAISNMNSHAIRYDFICTAFGVAVSTKKTMPFVKIINDCKKDQGEWKCWFSDENKINKSITDEFWYDGSVRMTEIRTGP